MRGHHSPVKHISDRTLSRDRLLKRSTSSRTGSLSLARTSTWLA